MHRKRWIIVLVAVLSMMDRIRRLVRAERQDQTAARKIAV